MTPVPHDDAPLLRAEIAAVAARLVAEDGADYPQARRKAAQHVLGEGQHKLSLLPDHAQIEAEVRRYQSLFQGATQPARLLRLRTLAAEVMGGLARFDPLLSGAVLHGTAGAHDDIHLLLFADSPKDVEIFLLNQNLQIDISETPHFKGPRHAAVETVSFLWQREGVHCALYQRDDLRGARKARADGTPARADLAAVRALLTPSKQSPHDQPPLADSVP